MKDGRHRERKKENIWNVKKELQGKWDREKLTTN